MVSYRKTQLKLSAVPWLA